MTLRLPELLNAPETKTLLEDFLENYLFALQLIDDLADMAEDFKAPKNHNLFVGQSSSEDYQLMYSRRRSVLADLLSYIERNMARYHSQPLFTGTLFEDYLKGMNIWIARQRREGGGPYDNGLLPSSFSDHALPLTLPHDWLTKSPLDESSELPSRVSAPAAHRRYQHFIKEENP